MISSALNQVPTKELADFLGVSMGFVSHIKKGRRKLPPKDCVSVSSQFGIPLSDLRPDIFPKPPNKTAA